MINLSFDTPRLRLICEVDAKARERLPAAAVAQLQARLADIRAAASIADLVVSRPILNPRPPGRVRFLLEGGYELVCVGSYAEPPTTEDGLVDFSRMRRLKVTHVGRVRSRA